MPNAKAAAIARTARTLTYRGGTRIPFAHEEAATGSPSPCGASTGAEAVAQPSMAKKSGVTSIVLKSVCSARK